MGLFDNLTEQFQDITSLITRIKNLESAIQSIETWRHQQADPDIKSNIVNISTMVGNMNVMYDNIKNVVSRVEKLPVEFESHLKNVVAPDITNNIKTSLTSYVDDMIDEAKSTITDWVKGFVGDPDLPLGSQVKGTILDFLNTAQVKAENAIAGAKAVFDKLQTAAIRLKDDANSIGDASGELLNSMEIEITGLKDQFISFGNKVYNSAIAVGESMGAAGKELNEAVTQISTPLSMVKLYAGRAKNDGLIFLPYNIFMTIAWGFLK